MIPPSNATITPDSDVILYERVEANLQKPHGSVVELYLGGCKLKDVKSLARFTNLQRLWLNSNNLRTLKIKQKCFSCIRSNYRITELHLQKNELISITGTISHLHNLQVLMLHNNQLNDIKGSVKEISSIFTLKRLNFFGNPLALDENYRSFIIYSLPSVSVLDRRNISTEERIAAEEFFKPSKTKNQVAFGRHDTVTIQASNKNQPVKAKKVFLGRRPTSPRRQVRFARETSKKKFYLVAVSCVFFALLALLYVRNECLDYLKQFVET